MAHRAECLQRHLAAGYRPLVVLLQHQSADKADEGGIVREDADHVGPSLDLAVHPFQGGGGGDLRPMILGECYFNMHIRISSRAAPISLASFGNFSRKASVPRSHC